MGWECFSLWELGVAAAQDLAEKRTKGSHKDQEEGEKDAKEDGEGKERKGKNCSGFKGENIFSLRMCGTIRH